VARCHQRGSPHGNCSVAQPDENIEVKIRRLHPFSRFVHRLARFGISWKPQCGAKSQSVVIAHAHVQREPPFQTRRLGIHWAKPFSLFVPRSQLQREPPFQTRRFLIYWARQAWSDQEIVRCQAFI